MKKKKKWGPMGNKIKKLIETFHLVLLVFTFILKLGFSADTSFAGFLMVSNNVVSIYEHKQN